MSPPKTMVLSQQQQQLQQQQQQQIGQQVDQQALIAARQSKPRKRKSKQQHQPQQQQQQQQQQHSSIILEQQQNLTTQNDQQQQVNSNNHTINNDNIKLIESAVLNGQSKENFALSKVVNTFKPVTAVPAVVPSERTTLKKLQQQQVPTQVKENNDTILDAPKRAEPAISVDNPARINGKSKQLSTEEADDIDAGIELDGSSNSGSSVKDINDDQLKSTSVSPVMAQSNLINETTTCVSQQNIELGVSEELKDVAVVCSAPSPAKKISTTKQQLAANQQVIDADEQLLQERLQNKQRKSEQNNLADDDNQKQVADKLLKTTTTTTTTQSTGQNQKNEDSNTTTASNSILTNTTTATNTNSTPYRRRFSSQTSQEAQDSSLCKVCEQHVYQMERMLAEKSIYHKRCFRCHQCKIQLRVDNYSSHEGQVYCKAHHRQLFQPQVKLDSEDDVEIVAKSTSQTTDDYLLHRGRLSELSFSFLQPRNPEETRKRHMIIFENKPAELPKDVVRSDTKLDDGIEQLNLNLNNILEKFERGTAGNEEENQPTSAGVLIDKPSFNIKKTLMAFESRLNSNSNSNSLDEDDESRNQRGNERPVVKKLTNINGFLNRQNSIDSEVQSRAQVKPLAIRRSESLLMRLKKYESRIAGEHVEDEDSDEDENNNNNNNKNNKSNINAIGTQKHQMIICENEPAKLSKDIVRSDTKLDDGIQQLNLNVNNILEKFERGTTSNGEESQPTSASVVMEKPYFNIKKTLMAFESRLVKSNSGDDTNESRVERVAERPVVKKLTNINGFLNRQNSTENENQQGTQVKPLAIGRSESLLMRLKKYESRVAGEQVEDEYSDDDDSVS